MRTAVILAAAALGLYLPSPAGAETQEQRYFSARDTAIAKVTAAMDAYTAMPEKPAKAKKEALDKVLAMDNAELAKLEQDMREIVGPVSIAGFGKDGKLNYDGLVKGDQGFGALDGLTFTSADKKTSIIVTTTGMFRHWLAEHKDWWGKNSNDIPQQPGRAVQQNAFYTQALLTDSAIVGFDPLHVRTPVGSVFTFAMLGSRTQDAMPEAADEIFFATELRGRAFIGQSRSFNRVGPIVACEAARKATLEYRPSTDQKAKELEARFLKCFSGRVRFQPNYAEALRAAQQFIDAVAAR